ncbi:putative metabolite transport protein CsbC [Aquicella siphonis]|uniref:Putative metabolite transport protein CsbC n=1 Tax=Aquicella siphonis TaxID=254247 RepID=A0A5E4PFC8_9COXI|nr:MFS transporter [Aquicella siphonis]VVC75690.1 putative metabolite transport protein CsbC [Aquicella siphonis]
MLEPECSKARAVSFLCSLGLFIAGYVFYSSSLIQAFYAAEFTLSNWQIGIAQSAVPLGAVTGAVLAGRLADLFGRHRLLVWNFLMLVLVSLSGSLIFDYSSLLIVRLLDGCLAGTLYPLCAAYLTEMTPAAALARQSAVLMFINCLAAPAACIVAILLSCVCRDPVLWRVMIASLAVPSLAAYIWSTLLPESQQWLYAENSRITSSHQTGEAGRSLFDGARILFSPDYRSVTLCLLGAWFLMDVAYYGINFFVPYLLQAMQINTLQNHFALSYHPLLSSGTVWGTLIINLFFALGALAAIFVIEKVDLIRLQKFGFFWAGISLFLLAGYFYTDLRLDSIIIILFVVFNFAINLGPDVTTYLLSATSYPVEIRGSGHGLIAGFAKFGSFLGVLLLPWLQDLWGYQAVILLLSVFLFMAYMMTVSFARVISAEYKKMEAEIIYETN